MTWRATDPQGDEAGKVRFDIVPFTRGVGLDVGCGPKKAYPHMIGVDSCADTALFGIQMKPDVVCKDAANLDAEIENASVDFIFSSHLLEHIQDTRAALANWWSKIKPGGHLVLYLPHRDFYPNVGQPGANPDHKHDFVPLDIQQHLAAIGSWELVVEEERDGGTEYSFLQVFRKRERDDGLHLRTAYGPRPEKTVCVVRYGGFGDSIQAANILPELKRQGYHVTFMTTPRGQDILLHDPHIDAWEIQDNDQVPNHELADFWAARARRFDKFINLSESVEGTLLAMPGRANHAWPDSLRRRELGQNYLEFTSAIAELPYRSESRFYAAPEEVEAARGYLAGVKNTLAGPLRIGMRAMPRFNIMWCLSGSSIHKFYPGQDEVMAAVLGLMPEAVIITNGDGACQILESGWEDQPRVRCESGNMGIRETLALAQQVDCVVGPETGVLNAVGFEDVGKVILLSHSSPENLTKHWINAEVLTPASTSCYPCHRLHYGRDFCRENPTTGAAACQHDINPSRVLAAIGKHYEDWKVLQQIRELA